MHARVGLKGTMLADYKPSFDFNSAYNDAMQMLKLLTKVLEDDHSTDLSIRNGVLICLTDEATSISSKKARFQKRDSIGRYFTSDTADDQISKAEDLFSSTYTARLKVRTTKPMASNSSLTSHEKETIRNGINAVISGASASNRNATIMFSNFCEDHLLQMRALILYFEKCENLGFKLDSSAADLPAQRYFLAYLFSNCLREAIESSEFYAEMLKCREQHTIENQVSSNSDGYILEDDANFTATLKSILQNIPTSSVMWALHSESQNFILQQCIHPQATWDDLRPLWLGLWVKELTKLREIIERYSRYRYSSFFS